MFDALFNNAEEVRSLYYIASFRDNLLSMDFDVRVTVHRDKFL